MWEPSQATLDKDINGLVLLASAGCRLFGELKHRETVYVLCGGKGTAPGCALHGSPKVPSVRPILSELIGAATESATVIRDRAPSGPVKVVVTNQPHSRPNAGIDLASGVSALLAWFPASWASKVAPCFIGDAGGATCRKKWRSNALPGKRQTHSEMMVTKCFKQLSSLTRKYLVYT